MNSNITPQVLVDFYSKLSQLLLPEESIIFAPPGPQMISYGQENKIPLLNICSPQVNASYFFILLEKVSEIIIDHYPYLKNECRQILSALPVEISERELFVDNVFKPGVNLLALLKNDVSSETFGFLITHTVKPLMRQFGKIASPVYDLEEWMKGSCPVCGGRPSLSLLEKEVGRRYLYCGLCEVKWRFQRIGCPYCANPESQFLRAEGEEKYRIYYCENCSGYIKTIDERKMEGTADLFWEDINTVYLDILALREGYINIQPELPLSDLKQNETG
ncbi:MAG: Uncharacterized protein XE00_0408 [Desulfofundulus kuznetsovii]|nr:MAG: Uncharacterized protein XD84_0839 [Desulfotomaculum sp. 46_80]KUK85057.1 MAG: Uncharacterized protein XE00_0408 [Desulfofundulus kuznetsovii]